MGKIERIEVSADDRERLRGLVRDRNTPQKVVWRARIVLLAGEGMGAVEVGREIGVSVPTVHQTVSVMTNKRQDNGRHFFLLGDIVDLGIDQQEAVSNPVPGPPGELSSEATLFHSLTTMANANHLSDRRVSTFNFGGRS
jgi:hypothetical protein